MAAIGDGWATNAWIQAGWITGAWFAALAALGSIVPIITRRRRCR